MSSRMNYNQDMDTTNTFDQQTNTILDESGFSMQLRQDNFTSSQTRGEYYEIIYIIDGDVTYASKTDKTNLSIGDLRLISPDVQYSISGNSSSLLRTVTISRSVFEDYLALITHSEEPSFSFPLQKNSVHLSVSELMELEAIALRYSSVSDLTRKRGIGAEMMAKILNRFFNEIETSHPSDSPLMQRILDLLNTPAGIRGGLPYICKTLQYSESYVSHRFKFHRGVTFSQYIKDTRLKYIEYYLKTTNYSLKNIADLVGIESLSYLNRIFKEKYNVTPLKYRKLYANPSPIPCRINQKRSVRSCIKQNEQKG